MIYATPEQLTVHRQLMDRLPVRVVVCEDEPVEAAAAELEEVERAELWELPAGLTFIQRAEIRDRRMLTLMRPRVRYTAKRLAAMAGMSDKTFYTHVKRMVQRRQLVRLGTRRHFRYRKA
jgi:hypothetical protein